MSNRTVMPSDASSASVRDATNLGNQANPTVTNWLDTRGWSWVDFICTMDNAVNTTSLVVVFEQASGATAPAGTYPASDAGVRSFAHESWDSTSNSFKQKKYTAESPTLGAGGYAGEGWTFTVPTHGRWVRMVVYGTGISSPSGNDTVVVHGYRRS